MKTLNKLVLVVLIFGLLACSSTTAGGKVPRPMPQTRIELLNGGYTPLLAYRGNPLVLVFWASSCSASKSMIKELNQLAGKIDPARVNFLAVSLDKPKDYDQLLGMIRGTPLDKLQHAYSGNEGDDEAFIAFQGEDIPQLFVISPQGVILAHERDTTFVEEYLRQQGLLVTSS